MLAASHAEVDSSIQATTVNPIRRTESQKNSIYTLPSGDLSVHLQQELKEGIVNLLGGSRQRNSLEREFLILHEAAMRHPQPQNALLLLLFRKYSEAANDIKDRLHNDLHLHNQSGVSLIDDLQHNFSRYSLESDIAELSGWDAMKTYTFWIRFGTAVFGFLAVVLMSSVPYVGSVDFAPKKVLTSHCPTMIRDFFRGSFSMQPYQLIISVGVISYLYSFLMMLYFMLPVDASKRKFVPGLQWLLSRCVSSQERIDEIADALASCTRRTSSLTLFALDAVLLALLMSSVLLASIMIERSSPFVVDIYGTVQYYTLGSFYASYSNTTPPCVSSNPCPTMRAALAMAYFAMIIHVLSFHTSYRGYQMERKTCESRSSIQMRTLHRLAGDDEIVEMDMRALPVPTHGDEDDGDDNPRPGAATVDEATV